MPTANYFCKKSLLNPNGNWMECELDSSRTFPGGCFCCTGKIWVSQIAAADLLLRCRPCSPHPHLEIQNAGPRRARRGDAIIIDPITTPECAPVAGVLSFRHPSSWGNKCLAEIHDMFASNTAFSTTGK